MPRKSTLKSMNLKIEAAQKKLSRNQEQAEALKKELLRLHREREALMSREIFEAFKKSIRDKANESKNKLKGISFLKLRHHMIRFLNNEDKEESKEEK